MSDCREGHEWRFFSNKSLRSNANFINELQVKKIECDQPNKLLCIKCLQSVLIKCKALKDYHCVPCALSAKRDKKLALQSGLKKSPMGWVELTLTAPGVEALPWDKSKCNHLASIKCSGKIGCKVDELDGALFNGSMPKNWNRYMQAVRRLFNAEIQYGKVFEAQARDLLHIHALLVGVPAWPVKRINKELRRLAKVHNLGGQISVKRVLGESAKDRQRAVGYVGKYLTKGSKTLKTLNLKTGEVRSGGYRDFTQSRAFGDTLKEIRAQRLSHYLRAHVGAMAQVTGEREAETVTALSAEGALDNYKKSYTLKE